MNLKLGDTETESKRKCFEHPVLGSVGKVKLKFDRNPAQGVLEKVQPVMTGGLL